MGCPFFVTKKVCNESYQNQKGCFNPSAWKECSIYKQLKNELSEKKLTRILRYTENITKIKQKQFFIKDINSGLSFIDKGIVLRKQYGYKDKPLLEIKLNDKKVLVKGIGLTNHFDRENLFIDTKEGQIHIDLNQLKRISIEITEN